jgi:hypothetical protein
MNPCLTEALILQFLDGAASPIEQRQVNDHLDSCPTCRSVMATLARGAVREIDGRLASATLDFRADDIPRPMPTLVSTRFDVVQCLGAGGMGVVFEAHDRVLDTRVALKTLRHFDGPRLLRFKNEFRALADLHHPNLVQLHQLFYEAGQWFFSMELVRGQPFLRWVRPTGDRVDGERLRGALAGLTDGLCALHGAHKVHCDIKPSNVLVEDDGRVVLLDFGLISEAADHDAGATLIAGTPEFMAPEQAAGLAVGPEADWYSVGVMLFQALTGELPLSGDRAALIKLKATAEPVAPSTRVPDVPADLDALCLSLLQLDPRARPTADEVRARLGTAPSSPQRGGSASFIGRRTELDQLRAAMASARAGATTALLLEGESGVGKTALAARFADELWTAGALVLAGRCYERESVPYKALDGIFDELVRVLAPLDAADMAPLLPPDASLLVDAFPVLSSVSALGHAAATATAPPDPAERRHRLFAAARTLLAQLAARRGALVLIIDDVQWSDGDSLALLAELMRAPSLLLVMTGRPGATVALPCPLLRLALAGLDDDDARALAAALVGDATVDAARLAAEAAGHPLFIAELARHAGEPTRGELTLDRALAARIAELSRERAALLELLAVAAGPLAQATLLQAARAPINDFTRDVAQLRAAQLVRTDEAAIQLYHDRVRAAVLLGLDELAQRERHRRLAATLEASGRGDAEALLAHWRGAGEPVRAAGYALLAAANAERALAFERAARLYRMTLELDPDRADAAMLHERSGDAFAHSGLHAEAAAAYVAAARGREPAAALDLRRRAAERLLFSAHAAPGLAILDEVLAAVGLRRLTSARRTMATALWLRARLAVRGLGFTLRSPREIPATLLTKIDVCRSAAVGLMGADQLHAFLFHTRRLLYALDAGEPVRLAEALATEVGMAAMPGPLGAARVAKLMAIASELTARIDQPIAQAQLVLAQGTLAFYRGQWTRCVETLARAEQLLRDRCVGATDELLILTVTRTCATLFRGDLATLRAGVPAALREAEERGQPFAKIWFRTGFTTLARLADGDAAEAQRQLEAARAMYPPRETLYYLPLDLYASLNLALYAGEAEAAWAELQARWPVLAGTNHLRQMWLRILLWDLRGRVALAAATATTGAARRQRIADAARAARLIERERMAWAEPLAQLLRSGLLLLDGDRAGAAARLADAAGGFAAADMTLHAAVARHRRAALLPQERERGDWLEAHKIADPTRFTRIFAPLTTG